MTAGWPDEACRKIKSHRLACRTASCRKSLSDK